MTDILWNEVDKDIDITSGALSLVSGADEIKQLIRQRLRTFYGEWFLDTEEGVKYFDVIFTKQPDYVLVRSELINTIISTPGVLELLEYNDELDTQTREFRLTFKVRVEDDVINFSEVIP